MSKTYNLFISHSWKNIHELVKLRNLLEQRGYFHVKFLEATPDVPINSLEAQIIKRKLTSRISKSDVVLAIAGIYATHSYWMNWEIKTASKYEIPIIGVIPRGQQRISMTVQNHAIGMVRWQTESIVLAIRQFA